MAIKDSMSSQARSNTRTALWALGTWIGGPWGGAVGAILGAKLFGEDPPPPPNPQRALLLNTTDQDSVIPIVLGTVRANSNYIWHGKLEKTPLEEGSSGASGGEKAVTGYKYKMNAMDAIAEGPLWISRGWKNGETEYIKHSTPITLYNGTADQTADPLFTAEVDHPVPYENLAYVTRDSYSLGRQATAPTFFYEVHKYPYNATVGDTARVYSQVADKAEAATIYGIPAKTSDGKIWLVNDIDQLKRYSMGFETLLDTIDITALNINTLKDTQVVEFGKKRYLDILYSIFSLGVNYMYIARVDLTKAEDKTELKANFFSAKELWNDNTGPDVTHNTKICNNDDNIFVVYYTLDGGVYKHYAKKYSWDLVLDSTVELTSLDAGFPYVGADCNNEFLFIHYLQSGTQTEGRVASFDVATLTNIDTLDVGPANNCDGNNLAVLRGGDELIIGNADTGSNAITMYVIGFDSDGDNLAVRKKQNLTPQLKSSDWTGKSITDVLLKWTFDGSILISTDFAASNYNGVAEFMTSLNPAQAIYYLLVDKGRYSSGDISATSLSDFSDFCYDNHLGLSDIIERKEFAIERADAYVNIYQGKWLYDSDAKLGIQSFRSTDTSAATITDDDIYFGTSDSVRNSGIGEIEIKTDQNIANNIRVTYNNRRKDYATESFSIPHFLATQEAGRVITEEISYFPVPQDMMAAKLAQRALIWANFKTRAYALQLTQKYMYLRPGQLITVTSSELDLTAKVMRILDKDEPTLTELGGPVNLICAVEDVATNDFHDYIVQQNNAERISAKPPVSVQPFVFEQDAAQNDDTYSICIGAISYSEDTAGAEVWVSVGDQSNYNKLPDDLKSFAIVGDIVNAIDGNDDLITVNTGQYPFTFPSFTVTEQRENLAFCLIGEVQADDAELLDLEMVSYRGVVTSGANLDLENCTRGRYYTERKPHGTDEIMILTGLSRFVVFRPTEDYVGKTVYIKMLAFNERGETEDFSEVSAFEYTIEGWTRKATKVSALEWYDNVAGAGQGSLDTVDTNSPYIQWIDTNRIGGAGRTTAGQYLEFIEGDINAWDLIIYNSASVYVAIRTDIQDEAEYTADGLYNRFQYTAAMNAADFGILTKDIHVAIVPRNARGDVRDVGGTRNNVELLHGVYNT